MVSVLPELNVDGPDPDKSSEPPEMVSDLSACNRRTACAPELVEIRAAPAGPVMPSRTSSFVPGTLSLLQFAASCQSNVPPPPSQLFAAPVLITAKVTLPGGPEVTTVLNTSPNDGITVAKFPEHALPQLITV